MADSNRTARTISRLAAGVFGLIFAITLPLTLVAFAWGSVLFSADQITEIFTDELVGSGALQELAIEVMLEQVPRGGGVRHRGRDIGLPWKAAVGRDVEGIVPGGVGGGPGANQHREPIHMARQ